MFVRLCLGVLLASIGVPLCAQPGIESTYADHARGVSLARKGRHDAGLALLYPLLARFPDDYSLRRDVVLINTWKSDCEQALQYFVPLHRQTRLDAYLIDPVASCAVERARTGDHDAAIAALAALLPHAIDPYPLRRDLTLVSIWSGDCRRALVWFEPIRHDERNQPYLIEPVVNCLRRDGRRTEAFALANAASKRYPEDSTLQLARTRAEVALRVDENYGDERPVLWAGVSTNESDRGAREWLAQTDVSTGISESLRVYARYLASWAHDDALDAGEMSRAGAGLRWYPDVRFLLDGAVSTDLDQEGREGAHVRAEYRPYDTLRLGLRHDTYAEDISVRARANGIEAKRSQASVQYTSIDYVWEWRGTTSRFDFTDTNRRTDFYTTLGYAFELQPRREQRVLGEWYQSRNTLEGAPYFNPREDRSVALIHRTDFVFESRFKRHVDHLYFWLGSYKQDNFAARSRWGARYEQDYDFTSDSALSIGGGFYSNVYDGDRENEWRFDASYKVRF